MDDKVYESWETLPRSKIRLESSRGSERLWTRVLPEGVGLDNDPVWEKYRYQDIVEPVDGMPVVLYRRWNAKIWFNYTTEDELRKRRQLLKILKPHGMPSFFTEGLGYILMKERESALHTIITVLAKVSYVKDVGELDAGIHNGL